MLRPNLDLMLWPESNLVEPNIRQSCTLGYNNIRTKPVLLTWYFILFFQEDAEAQVKVFAKQAVAKGHRYGPYKGKLTTMTKWDEALQMGSIKVCFIKQDVTVALPGTSG